MTERRGFHHRVHRAAQRKALGFHHGDTEDTEKSFWVSSEEIRAFNAVQPLTDCSAGRAIQPLPQGTAE